MSTPTPPTWPARVMDPHVPQWDTFTTPRHSSGLARRLRPLPRVPRVPGRLAPRADREFVEDPHHLMKPQALAGKLGGRARAVTLDVTDLEACADAVASVLADHGRLDVVWANAGRSDFGPVETMPGEAWRRIVQVNLLGGLPIVMVGSARRAAPPSPLRPTACVAAPPPLDPRAP